jgi:hypothetical protein
VRLSGCLAIAFALMPAAVFAQAAPAVPEWELSASAYTYVLPDEDNFLQPSFTADRGRLHLEARVNYESLDTASAWLGYNLGGGETVTWELTPMIGAVFGGIDGVAPGYKGSLAWKKLEFYSEGEYLFDAGDTADSFFYNWSELTFAPVESFRFGLVTQRTRVYQTERDIQRGLLAGFSFNRLDLTGYVFNPDGAKPTVVVAIAVTF